MSRLLRATYIFIAVAVGLIATSWQLFAAEPAAFFDGVDSEHFPLVTAHLVVIDEKGLPVIGISPDAISVAEDGKVVRNPSLSSLVAAEEPVAVTLVIDTSLSMAGKPLDDARNAAGSFVDDIGVNDEAAIIAFAGEVFPIRDFTSDKQALKTALASLAVGPNTALFDALIKSLDIARQAAADRQVIVLLTDGHDTSSRQSFDAAIKAAVAARIPIYTIGLGEDLDKRVLDQISASTGGRSLYAPSSSDLQFTFKSLASQLKSRYVLKFQSQLKADNQLHSISISTKLQGKKADGTAQFTATARPPRVVFLSPRETVLTGKYTVVEVKVESAAPVIKVVFAVDRKPVSEVQREPFRFVWYRDVAQPGRHSIEVTATDSAGNTSSQEVEVFVDVPTVPQASVIAPDPTPTPILDSPSNAIHGLNLLVPLPAAGSVVLGLLLVAARRRRTNSPSRLTVQRKQGRLRFPRFLTRPRCPVCRKRLSRKGGCAPCQEQEAKTIAERLQQIFRDDVK